MAKKVAVIMGSDSDLPVVEKAIGKLKEYGVPYEVHVYSAHRTPVQAAEFSRTAQDRLVLLSTHIIEDVQSVCDRLVVIDHGQILFTGTPEQLIQAAEGHVGVFWEREAGQEQGLHITARVNASQGVRCRAVADALPAYVQRSEPSLEDAYLYLISREAVQ